MSDAEALLREALRSLEACACPGKFYRAGKYGLTYRIREALAGSNLADPPPSPTSATSTASPRPALRIVPAGERVSGTGGREC